MRQSLPVFLEEPRCLLVRAVLRGEGPDPAPLSLVPEPARCSTAAGLCGCPPRCSCLLQGLRAGLCFMLRLDQDAGSAIARIIGSNATSLRFANTVKMWVYEENINGRNLSDIINTEHENIKYLPGYKLPENVVAVPKLRDAAEGADLLVFVVPHQFIRSLCDDMKGCSRILENGLLFKELLQTPNFRIRVADDAGALKNIVAVGAGLCDGRECSDNTKAAVIRLGLMEMIAFAKLFSKNGPVSTTTFLESCGVADLITTCHGGRNRRVAEAFSKTGKSVEELEREMLNGQKLQGPATSAQVYYILQQKGLVDKFPLFTAVYQICFEGRPVQQMISCLQSHPEHVNIQ
ncbi:hypothetical protein F7725_018955 [Dissostichus mawsoni]|uniref:Glycerol-3-phosphate dehydrogenase [NAD(+)] n=1 Tax=Dissostichus mawsoni TaxID=36200 RepID=A0A7J5XVT4_DISMA|nr:hypothetical protein F7725_018955 [Dissostichus mawsoni]